VLKRLAADGLVRAQERKVGGRAKTLYGITPAGRKHLRGWLDAPVEVGKPRDELILKLFFGSEADIPVLIRQVTARRDRAQALLQQCRQWEQENLRNPESYGRFFRITIRAGIATAEANLHWAEETLQALTVMAAKPSKS
jgi:PadR family transcriptional regulator, regulatory protein AphA